MPNLVSFLQRLQEWGPRVCVENEETSYSYAQLLEEITAWQCRFDAVNIPPATIIAVRADYSLSAIASLLAILARGAVAALIPREAEVMQYLIDAHASALLEVHADGRYAWDWASYASCHPLIDQLRTAQVGGLIIFTSGSTGRPKAALHSVERLLCKFRRPGRAFRTLAFLLFDHIAGIDTLFYALGSGGTLILTRRRTPISILELVESHRVEVLPTSPTFLRLLCATPDGEYDLSSLKIITYGSEPMDSTTLARLNVRFPNAKISQKYGTTETGSPKSLSRGNDSLWLKMKSEDVETKVVDGVLWIRSESTILGYLNAPSPIDAEGWYCTGDLVEVDGEWIRFCGRATDIINVGGEKVTPGEVEQSILELDFVREVVVSGKPHVLMGQMVAALVALASNTLDAREATKRIRLHCQQRLASHKVPVEIEITTLALTNDRQKLRRQQRRE